MKAFFWKRVILDAANPPANPIIWSKVKEGDFPQEEIEMLFEDSRKAPAAGESKVVELKGP